MNVALLLEMAADGFGDRLAIGSRHSGGLTYAMVLARARAGAAVLQAAAPGGTHVAMVEPNGAHVPVTLFAAAWAGRSYAPLNYRLPPEGLAALLSRLDSPFVVGSAPVESVTAESVTAESVTCMPVAEWMAADQPSTNAYPADPDQPAVLLFTSGTSAEPKAAVLDHDHLCAYVFNTSEFASAAEDEAVLVAVPPFHIAGVSAVLSAFYLGRRIVALPAFSAEDWLDTAQREAVTHAFLVPTMLARIVVAAEADPTFSLPALRSLAYGGARMPEPVLERALKRFPGVDFVNAYGLTETSSTVCVLGPEEHRAALASSDPLARRRLASVGRPVEGIEVRVVADESASASTSTERPGELQLRGAQVSGAYVGHPSQVDEEGWLHTGDHGWIDDEGYVFVVGRGDDTIIRGGENISPSEIEDVLLRHPSVAAAAVVGLADEEWGERVGAMIVLRQGMGTNGEELFRWARERLGSLKAPEIIVLRSELPSTATGKILRRQIRAELSG